MKANEHNHNYMRNIRNKQREKEFGKELSLKKLAKSKMDNEDKYGKYRELIKIGEADRLGGNLPPVIIREDVKKSYEYGYYIKGSRTLAGKFEQGIYSIEEQRIFGIRDLNNGIKEDYLLKLKDFPHYMNGRIYQMGRKIYDYIEINNLEIDEYINLMSIIDENVKNPEFAQGYYDQKEENANKKRR